MKNNKLLGWLLGLGAIGVVLYWLVGIAISVATVLVWLDGVIFGFHQSILLGLVSLIPFVGFFEGLLHLLHLI